MFVPVIIWVLLVIYDISLGLLLLPFTSSPSLSSFWSIFCVFYSEYVRLHVMLLFSDVIEMSEMCPFNLTSRWVDSEDVKMCIKILI